MKFKYFDDVVSLKFDQDLCNRCLRCIEVCPRNVFLFQDKHISLPKKHLCIECGACVKNCPEGALKVSVGVGCAGFQLNKKRIERLS